MSEQAVSRSEHRSIADRIFDTLDRLDEVVPTLISSAVGLTALSGVAAEYTGQLGRGIVIGAGGMVVGKIIHRDWVEAGHQPHSTETQT